MNIKIKPNQTNNTRLSFLFLRVWFHWYSLIGMSSMWVFECVCLTNESKRNMAHVPFGHNSLMKVEYQKVHFWLCAVQAIYYTLNRHLFYFIFSLWLNQSQTFFSSPNRIFLIAFLYDTILNTKGIRSKYLLSHIWLLNLISQYLKFFRKKRVWTN